MPYLEKYDPRLYENGKVVINQERSESIIYRTMLLSKNEDEVNLAITMANEISFGYYKSYKWIEKKELEKNEKKIKEKEKMKNGMA